MDLGLNMHDCEECNEKSHCALEIPIRYFKEHQYEYLLLQDKLNSEWFENWKMTAIDNILYMSEGNSIRLGDLTFILAIYTGWALAQGEEFRPVSPHSRQNEQVYCARCHWSGHRNQLPDGICPSCLTPDKLEFESERD